MSKKKTTKNTGTQRKKSHSPKGLRTARAWKYIQQVQRWVRTHPELDVLQREARDTDSDRAKRRIEATVNTYDDMLQLLRHGLFHTVVPEASKNRIPLRHFTSTGVGSCAEKLYKSLQS